MPSRRIWLIDGHNAIFRIPPLRALQTSARGAEARDALVERLERFALAGDRRVVVVFDGGKIASSAGSVRTSSFEIVYARGGGGAADRFIIDEAGREAERGAVVTVVTDDVSTLAAKLPRRVRHVKVREFWLTHIESEPGEAGGPGDGSLRLPGGGRTRPGGGDPPKRIEGDFSDVERDMLAQAAAAEAAGADAPAGRAGEVHRNDAPRPRPSPAPIARRDAAAQAGRPAGDRVRDKRERGRLRQERRLGRRAVRSVGRK